MTCIEGCLLVIKESAYIYVRTIPLRVDTLNNKSVNPRGCFAL